MADKIVRQNTGFIAAESQRARENLERSRAYQAEGNERAAKALQTKAANQMKRVNSAADTIMDRTKQK